MRTTPTDPRQADAPAIRPRATHGYWVRTKLTANGVSEERSANLPNQVLPEVAMAEHVASFRARNPAVRPPITVTILDTSNTNREGQE